MCRPGGLGVVLEDVCLQGLVLVVTDHRSRFDGEAERSLRETDSVYRNEEILGQL